MLPSIQITPATSADLSRYDCPACRRPLVLVQHGVNRIGCVEVETGLCELCTADAQWTVIGGGLFEGRWYPIRRELPRDSDLTDPEWGPARTGPLPDAVWRWDNRLWCVSF